MQSTAWLRGREKTDYLLQPLQGGKKITMNITEPLKRGLYINILTCELLCRRNQRVRVYLKFFTIFP